MMKRSKYSLVLILAPFSIVFPLACSSSPTTPAPTPVPTHTPTVTLTPTVTSTSTISFTPTITFTPTNTFQPTPVETDVFCICNGSYPSGLVVSGSSVYVADDYNNTIQKYNLSGTPDPTWPTPAVDHASGLAMDGSGNLYAANGGTDYSVTKLNSQATPVATWTTGGKYAAGVAYDGTSNIYVTNYENNSIQQYSTSGTLGNSWADSNSPYGLAVNGGLIYAGGDLATNTQLNVYNSSGVSQGGWAISALCTCLGVDGLERIYVGGDGLVQRFSTGGLLQTQWNVADCDGIGFDSSNNIYISDPDIESIRVFTP